MARQANPARGAAVAERFAQWAAGLTADAIPASVRDTATLALIDHAGLAVSARNEPYVRAIVDMWDDAGP